MPRAAASQLQLFDPEPPPSDAISPARLAVVRKAVFGNLTALKNAAPAQIAAPGFAEWVRRFEALAAKLPEAERAEAVAAMRALLDRPR